MTYVAGERAGREPLVLEVKGNALDDGPGIRSVVFLKGCPLSCLWCHNPESKRVTMELSFDEERCIGCGTCASSCPTGALSAKDGQGPNRSLCMLCMDCTKTCPSKALEVVGRRMSVDEVVAEVKKDQPFFDASGGGVTLSGGEPTLHLSFCSDLLKAFHQQDIHTLLETCGHFSWPLFESEVLPFVDTIYCDVKFMDSDRHKRYCGIPNRQIVDNLKRLLLLSRNGELDFLPRIPLIPGITATDDNIGDIAAFLTTHGGYKVQVMPYNPLWLGKNKMIGCPPPLEEREELKRFMDPEEVKRYVSILETAGLSVM